jgi:hypothetical protein
LCRGMPVACILGCCMYLGLSVLVGWQACIGALATEESPLHGTL